MLDRAEIIPLQKQKFHQLQSMLFLVLNLYTHTFILIELHAEINTTKFYTK